MAITSNWLRWNVTSHIFEYSTDNGATYVPLPLNASILNEGLVNPARLPPTGPTSSGDVVGPSSATDNAIALYSGVTGKLIKNSTVIISAAGNITGVGTLGCGAITSSGALSCGAVNCGAIVSTGNITAAGQVIAPTGLVEFNRSFAMGTWSNVAWSAGLFVAIAGTWTVEAADLTTFAWTIIGKTMIVAVEINNSSQSATSGELRITIPVGAIPTKTMTTVGWSTGSANDANSFNIMVMVAAGVSYISIKPLAASTGAAANFLASTNVLDIRFQIAFQFN